MDCWPLAVCWTLTGYLPHTVKAYFPGMKRVNRFSGGPRPEAGSGSRSRRRLTQSRKLIRKQIYRISFDTAFVCYEACQTSGVGKRTWITPEMKAAYVNLHSLGHAHSVEVWHDEFLVGGLYGIALGKAFFGESMFSAQPNASKLALVALSRQLESRGFGLIDCQVHSDHLVSMGAEALPRRDFQEALTALLASKEQPERWKTPPNNPDGKTELSMQSNNKPISSIRLFRTSLHPCSYKASEEAATVFVDPDLIIDKRLNSKLSELGYRRSGAHLYSARLRPLFSLHLLPSVR